MRCVLASLALLALGSALPAQEVLEETFEDGRPRIRREVRRTATGEALNHGEYKEWYANGKVRSKGEYASGLRTGRWLVRWENGRRQAQGSYTNGERDGIWQLYAEAGTRFARGAYLAGVRDGEWTFWTPGRELDPDRSGVYRATVLADDTAAGWEGETLDGQRHGRWTYFRPHRRTMMVGDYERGAMHGAWLFLHADGTVEPDWFTGRYEHGVRVGPVAGPPAGVTVPPAFRDLARVPLYGAPPALLAAVDTFLRGDASSRRGALERLLADPRAAFPAILDRLVRLDLSTRPGEALARRLEEHVLAVICGGGRLWVRGTDDVAVASNTLSILRWYSLWELMADRPELWAMNFDPAWRWIEIEPRFTVLAQPPPPPGLVDRLPARAVGDSPALGLAIDWIAAQQSDSGAWRPAAHGGDARLEAGVTAICLLAIQREGSTAVTGRHRESVERGLHWLVLHQVPMTGAISRSPVDTEFQNALAAEALVEGAATSGIPVVRQSAYRTIAYLTAVQHGDGSWGTTVDDDRGHPVVTAAVLRALHAARAAGIAVDEQHLVRGLAWLHGRTDLASGEGEGRMSGALTSHSSAAATAATLLVRMLAGQAPELPIVRIQARWLKSHPPVIFPDMDENDPLYVYLGTSALRYVGGGEWAAWSDAAHDLLATVRMSNGAQAATWDPLGLQPGAPGGRLWSTALAALTLEELLRPK